MTHDDWRAALFARRTLGVRLGTAALAAVLDELLPGLRERPPFRVTQIVGTNGKGSTAALLDQGLRAARARHPSLGIGPVGLYTSPHLIRVGERIRVDGVAVDDEQVRAGVDEVAAAERRAGVTLSFFEVLTAIALQRFAAAGCSHVVLEAGLGGRLDATTAIARDQVLIGRIGLDHQRFLGDSIAAIAGEKAAVIGPGMPVASVAQRDEAWAVIEAVARAQGATLTQVEPLARAPEGLLGEHQRHNGALALAGLRWLLTAGARAGLDPAAVDASLLDGVRWPGRMQREAVGGGTLWLDVAHNLDSVAALRASVDAIGLRPAAIVFGTLADKPGADMAAMLRGLAPLWLVPPAAEGSYELAPLAEPGDRRFAASDDPSLLAAVREQLGAGRALLVCGSHHLVGALTAALVRPGAPDSAPGAALDPSDPMPRA